MEQSIKNQKELIERLQSLAGQASFVSFIYRNKKAGELARHTIIFGVSYERQLRDSLTALSILEPTFVTELEHEAAQELRKSFEKSLEYIAKGEQNPDYTKRDAYVTIAPGLKYTLSTKDFNVSGLEHTKVVLEPGQYPKVESKPLTVAKNAIRRLLPVGRWREFCINCENLEVARLQGTELCLNCD